MGSFYSTVVPSETVPISETVLATNEPILTEIVPVLTPISVPISKLVPTDGIHMSSTRFKILLDKYCQKVDCKTIDSNQHYIIRCNGISFIRLRKNIDKSFHSQFKTIMYNIMKDTCEKFNADLGCGQYYEMSFIFTKREKHMFHGDCEKIINEITSFITSKFNEYMSSILRVSLRNFKFKGRIAYVSSDIADIYEYLEWRMEDGFRNCIYSNCKEIVVDDKDICNKPFKKMISILGCDSIRALPEDEKNGVFVLKEKDDFITKDWRLKDLKGIF